MNAIIVWNTLYLERALDALRAAGHTVRDEDMARLSPLVHETPLIYGYINPYGVIQLNMDMRLPIDEIAAL